MALLDVFSQLAEIYKAFILSLPVGVGNFINLFLFVVLIVIYAIFIWKFHHFIGTRNIFKFDLNQYNRSAHPVLTKIVAMFLYLIEYILLIPFLIFFWFAVFTFFLILFTEEPIEIGTILLVSAVAIASIRMATYIPRYGEKLARELAKIIPITLLAVAVLNPTIFTKDLLGRAISRFSEMSLFFTETLSYLIFIVFLEIILRFFEFLLDLLGLEDVNESEE